MIKVFQVIPTLEVGGAENLVLDIANNIDNTKFDMTIITYYDIDKFNINVNNYKNIKVKSFSKKKGIDLKMLIQLITYFIKEKPDVVHSHIYAAPYIFIPCVLSGVKVRIHTIHSMAQKELRKNKRILMKFAYKFLNFTPVAISDYVKKTIIDEYKLPSEKIECIYNGIDTKIFKPKKVYKANVNTFINVARISDVKNHNLLLDAFSLAIKENNKLKLKIVGNGPLLEDIKQKIKKLNLDKYIVLLGNLDKNLVQKELVSSDIFILTSKYEGLPLSVLEAMSCGLPIISTKVGGVIDVVDKNNGILVNQDEKELCQAILKLSNDSSLCKFLGENSHNYSKKYDVKVMVKEYERIYSRAEK